jgi:hypothetical protein
METWVVYVIIGIVIIGVMQVLLNSKKSKPKAKSDISKNQYKAKSFLTQNEKTFLGSLKNLTAYNLIVVPQVNLATVVQKVGQYTYQNELYRNIDFGIFDEQYNLLLLIELNDSTHNSPSRKERDERVRTITKAANIKLITFYTNMPNEPEYVVNRVMAEIYGQPNS